MRFILKIPGLLAVVALFHGAALATSFTAVLDRDVMTLGEEATLSLAFEGGQSKNVPTPNVPGLQIVQTGTSQNVSWINGAMSSTVTVAFSVTARQAGQFTIPALTANVNGQQLTTLPLKLTVTSASAPSAAAVNSGNEVAFLKFVFPKTKVYVGEPVVGRLDLYLRDDVSGLNGFQLTSAPTDGCSAGKTVELQNQRHQAQVGNRVYTVIPLAIPLTVVRSGPLRLGPFTASAVVVLPARNQGGDPFFRGLFNQGEQKQVTLATEPAEVAAWPLPEENKPANFTGAVGNFTMAATAGPTTLTVGDPITVRVQISGQGALDAVALPAQDAWRDFKTYPPTAKVEPGDPFGFQGTKTFEQIISPLNTEVRELPPLTFSFFNPDEGRYHTLKSAAAPLTIRAAGATPMPVLAANKNPGPENQPPQDILPIKESPGILAHPRPPLVAQPGYFAAQAVPMLAFLSALIWRQRTDRLANNPRLRRRLAVEKLIQTGRDDLRKFAAENNPDEFFALLFRLLQEQLGERLDCPASAITENAVGERLAKAGADAATLATLQELFQLCNQARYAPVRGASELGSVVAKFAQAAGALQAVKA